MTHPTKPMSIAERIEEQADELDLWFGPNRPAGNELRTIATDLRSQVGDVGELIDDLRGRSEWYTRYTNDPIDGMLARAATTIEAQARRIAELEREQAYADHCFKQMEERADALVAENAVLRAGYLVKRGAEDHAEYDMCLCCDRIGRAPHLIEHHKDCPLSTPNERASRVMEVVKAARDVRSNATRENLYKLADVVAALDSGEKP